MSKIYKYFRFSDCLLTDNTIDSFKNDYLWFSKPRFFNDPFDCNMEVINYYVTFLNEMQKRYPTFNIKDSLIEHTKDFGICCFSDANDSQHMWAHYANSHNGICIEYEYSEKVFDDYFSLELLQCKCELQDVDYRDGLINLDGDIDNNGTTIQSILSLPLDLKKVDILYEKLLLQKNKTVWGNEKEKRLLLMGKARENIQNGKAKKCKELHAGYKIPIKREMITGIIFGLKTPDKIKTKIKKIFGNAVSYKQAVLDFSNWILKIEDL